MTNPATLLPRLALAFWLAAPSYADAALNPAGKLQQAERTFTARAINIDHILQSCTETGQIASTKVSLAIQFTPENEMPADEALRLRSRMLDILIDGWRQETASITPSRRQIAGAMGRHDMAQETLAAYRDRAIARLLALPELARASDKELVVTDFYIERVPGSCATNHASKLTPGLRG